EVGDGPVASVWAAALPRLSGEKVVRTPTPEGTGRPPRSGRAGCRSADAGIVHERRAGMTIAITTHTGDELAVRAVRGTTGAAPPPAGAAAGRPGRCCGGGAWTARHGPAGVGGAEPPAARRRQREARCHGDRPRSAADHP